MINKLTHFYDSERGFSYVFAPIEDTIKSKKTKEGYEARYLINDNDTESPQEWGDNSLFLVGYHRDFTVENDKVITKQQAIDLLTDKKELEQYQIEWCKDFRKKFWVFRLEAYIHSGVSLALGNEGNFPDRRWDVSSLGLVLVSKAEAKTTKRARELALGLIGTWNTYLSGDVYTLVKENYNDKKEQIDFDTLGGVYGYKEALKELEGF